MLGIFDSGLGGLTVVRHIERTMPAAGYLYLGDTARLPYGTKSPETIERYAVQALRFLRSQGAKTPVVACHTVSSFLYANPNAYRRCAQLFRRNDLFEVVTPTIRAARNTTKNRRIGILGTTATVQSGAYQRGLRGYRAVPVAASVLVALAEEGWAKRGRAVKPILREIMRPFRRERVDTVILACTHFPILTRHIRDILGSSVRVIDPGAEIAAALGSPDLARRGPKRFFATDIPEDFAERASRFLGRSIRAKAVNL